MTLYKAKRTVRTVLKLNKSMKRKRQQGIIIRILKIIIGCFCGLALSGCGGQIQTQQEIPVQETEKISPQEVDLSKIGEKTEEDSEEKQQEEGKQGIAKIIVGTWSVEENNKGDWLTLFQTRFSADGRVVHFGHRNADFGRWEQKGEQIEATFDDCRYYGTDGKYELPAYSVTYTIETDFFDNTILYRSTDRPSEILVKAGEDAEDYMATDHDNYSKPLYYVSETQEITRDSYEYYPEYPHDVKNSILLERRVAELAEDLAEGREVELEQNDLPYQITEFTVYDITGDGREELFICVEPLSGMFNETAMYILSPKDTGGYTVLARTMSLRSGYTEVLAADGTSLYSQMSYASASSWKGGVRIHLGYRNGQVVVNQWESYWFHWDLPIVNRVYDFKNGVYYVYVARNPREGEIDSGSYIDIAHSIKIDEEAFLPQEVPFTAFEKWNDFYPMVYDDFHPFYEDWWLAGGKYPDEEGNESGVYQAGWLEEEADENPNEILREAVEKSGYDMEKKAYPWTEESKRNTIELLRYPVADYYYIGDYYAAAYKRGSVYFYEKTLEGDDYTEVWKEIDSLTGLD